MVCFHCNLLIKVMPHNIPYTIQLKNSLPMKNFIQITNSETAESTTGQTKSGNGEGRKKHPLTPNSLDRKQQQFSHGNKDKSMPVIQDVSLC